MKKKNKQLFFFNYFLQASAKYIAKEIIQIIINIFKLLFEYLGELLFE